MAARAELCHIKGEAVAMSHATQLDHGKAEQYQQWHQWAGEMLKSAKCLSCEHEDLNSIPRTQVAMTQHVGACDMQAQ